jgi:hypothetical protein
VEILLFVTSTLPVVYAHIHIEYVLTGNVHTTFESDSISFADLIENLYSHQIQEVAFNSHIKSKVLVEPPFTIKAGENIIMAKLSEATLVRFEILTPFFSK